LLDEALDMLEMTHLGYNHKFVDNNQ